MVIEQTRFRGSVASLLVVPGDSQVPNLIAPRIYAGISAKLSGARGSILHELTLSDAVVYRPQQTKVRKPILAWG